MKKEYLGDGVYVATDALGNVILTTEDGISVTNTIVLEPEVIDQLVTWLQEMK